MAVLSSSDIVNHLGSKVIIEPYNEKNLQINSYDVTLGENFYRNIFPRDAVLDVTNASHIKRAYFLYKAEPLEDINRRHNLDVKHSGIVLDAGESVLGHTNEFIGGRVDITTQMKARSSTGRLAFTVCRDAGQGDVGYVNRWTLEITNHNPHPIFLPVGAPIGQIVFLQSTEPIKTYNGNYQSTNDLDVLKAKWQPSDMLPKPIVPRS